jgi:hypothetical protein
MEQLDRFNLLREAGRIAWRGEEHGWLAAPDDVVAALSADGFHEYRREVLRSGHRSEPTGGLWQGIDKRTGAVASALWVALPDAQETIVFIDINGTPVRGEQHG